MHWLRAGLLAFSGHYLAGHQCVLGLSHQALPGALQGLTQLGLVIQQAAAGQPNVADLLSSDNVLLPQPGHDLQDSAAHNARYVQSRSAWVRLVWQHSCSSSS